MHMRDPNGARDNLRNNHIWQMSSPGSRLPPYDTAPHAELLSSESRTCCKRRNWPQHTGPTISTERGSIPVTPHSCSQPIGYQSVASSATHVLRLIYSAYSATVLSTVGTRCKFKNAPCPRPTRFKENHERTIPRGLLNPPSTGVP